MITRFHLLFFSIIFALGSQAHAKLCNPIKEKCFGSRTGSSTKPAYPSKSSSVSVNPSAVPIEDAFGIETIVYGSPDFALVKGTGRIGAAISTSNGEETFFGPPAFEPLMEYGQRKFDRKKYKPQKLGIATAIGLLSNKKQGLTRFEVNLGVAGKYNKISKTFLPGGGISGIAGPITFGYSRGNDQYIADYSNEYIGGEKFDIRYGTQTISAGIYLNVVAFDYSRLTISPEEDEEINITLMTGSLLLRRWIITAAHRSEKSNRMYFDYTTNMLVNQEEKKGYFGGVQFAVTRMLMLGAYYNYYLLNEVSLGATLFF